MGPELVVADEPVSMLDVSIRTELLRLMLDLREERGLTYLFITHDLSLAWVIADRIAVMYLGKIMEIGPAEQVIRRPAQPVHAGARVGRPDADPPAAGTRAARTILVGETPDAAHIPTGCRFHPRCPLAFDRCRVEEPPLFDVGDGQSAACWLAEGGRSLPVMPATVAPGAGSRPPMPRRPEEPYDRRRATATARPGQDRRPARRRGGHRRRGVPRPRRRRLPVAPGGGRMVRQRVLGHIVEAEKRGFAGRIRTTPRRGRPVVPGAGTSPPSPPRAATARSRPPPCSTSSCRFAPASVELVRGLAPADLDRSGLHAKVGRISVGTIAAEWVHHDRNHIRQILAIGQSWAWPSMGNDRLFSDPTAWGE